MLVNPNLLTLTNFNPHEPTSTHFMNFNKKSTNLNQLQSTSRCLHYFNQLLPIMPPVLPSILLHLHYREQTHKLKRLNSMVTPVNYIHIGFQLQNRLNRLPSSLKDFETMSTYIGSSISMILFLTSS